MRRISIIVIPGEGEEGIEKFQSCSSIPPATDHFDLVVSPLHGTIANGRITEAVFHRLDILFLSRSELRTRLRVVVLIRSNEWVPARLIAGIQNRGKGGQACP